MDNKIELLNSKSDTDLCIHSLTLQRCANGAKKFFAKITSQKLPITTKFIEFIFYSYLVTKFFKTFWNILGVL